MAPDSQSGAESGDESGPHKPPPIPAVPAGVRRHDTRTTRSRWIRRSRRGGARNGLPSTDEHPDGASLCDYRAKGRDSCKLPYCGGSHIRGTYSDLTLPALDTSPEGPGGDCCRSGANLFHVLPQAVRPNNLSGEPLGRLPHAAEQIIDGFESSRPSRRVRPAVESRLPIRPISVTLYLTRPDESGGSNDPAPEKRRWQHGFSIRPRARRFFFDSRRLRS